MKDTLDQVITDVTASILNVAPENPRSAETLDLALLDPLADNIEQFGVLSPLVGYEEAGQFYATAGGRRARAIQMLVRDERIPDDTPIPTVLMSKDEAIAAGHAEQLTHVKMSDIDELRIYAHPAYKDKSDADLARIVGKSVRAVKQRRAVLSLPKDVLDLVWTRAINVDQAHGLTYFIGDDERLHEMADLCQRRSDYDLNDLRYQFTQDQSTWAKCTFNALVTKEEYLAAGGTFSGDLFTEDEFIDDMALLTKLANEAAMKRVPKAYAEYGFVTQVANLYDNRTHRGMDNLTDDEREEWHDMRWSKWQHDEDEEPEWFKRYAELEAKAELFWPDELKALLGVVYTLNRNAKGGFETRINVLPDDLEPLYEGGWLERPAPQPDPDHDVPEEAAEDDGPKLAGSHIDCITRIKLHVARQEMVKDPNAVFEEYLVHHQKAYSSTFNPTPESAAYPPDIDGLDFSKQYLAAQQLNETDAETVRTLTPAERRTILAFKILQCVRTNFDTTRWDDKLRTYFTPGTDFLKRYKKPHLMQMLLDAGHEEQALTGLKVTALVEALADHAKEDKSFVPLGF